MNTYDINRPQTVLSANDLRNLKGVGPRLQERLARLGIHSVTDLLFHLPFRYQDRTRVVPFGALRAGDEAVVEGIVQLSQIQYGRRRMLLARLHDGTGSLTLRFFHFNASQQAQLKEGSRLRCFGEVRRGAAGLEMVHPEYRRLEGDEPVSVEEQLTPIYPTTDGLHQLTLRALTDQALALLPKLHIQEYLPVERLTQWQLPTLLQALTIVHRPPVDVAQADLVDFALPAHKRLIIEELLAHQLSLRQLRLGVDRQAAPVFSGHGELINQFQKNLPFSLTSAQQRVIEEIRDDLSLGHPMQRLVQGDVGSGKTVVAAFAALMSIDSGYQVAVMAPTELLAEQHARNFLQWLSPLNIPVVTLVGSLKGKQRRHAEELIENNIAKLIVGTHALFQESVVFAQLGLVVVDEQHRFGVHQRLALREKGRQEGFVPHQLILTATPIPRTLAMTAYADLDCSVIDELPPGRKPVETVVVAEDRRAEVVQRVKLACQSGRQAYWVCTLIDESEVLQCQAAEETARQLINALPELRVGLIHGRLKTPEKERIMGLFKAGELQLLVATTVIEVGVDVANASLMIIENAERLGLAQLHQLRGRVGRGAESSSCVLLYKSPLSRLARERLAVMRETNDGFAISQRDLDIRGPGEVLGTRQTGLANLRVADLLRDKPLLPLVQELASELLLGPPEPIQALIRRWIGQGVRYGEV